MVRKYRYVRAVQDLWVYVMKKEGFKYLAKVCSDGRLYNGAWYHISFLPVPEPNEAVFDEFPETGNGTSCSDYVWDGETLTYSPAVQPDASPAAESTVQIEDDGTEVTYGSADQPGGGGGA